MFIFRKIWRALFSWNTCFEIRPFALLASSVIAFVWGWRSSDFQTWNYIHANYITTNKWSLNPFVPNAPFLYPLKTSENLMVFLCFHGVENRCIGNVWVNINNKPWKFHVHNFFIFKVIEPYRVCVQIEKTLKWLAWLI